jgi:hypothetical protein
MFQTANPAVTTTPNTLDTYLSQTTKTLTNKTVNCANNTCTVRIGSDVSGLGTGVATFLATPSSANLLAALTTKTGTGSAVFGTSPTLSGLALSDVATGTQCLHANSSGVVSGTGSDCGAGGGGLTIGTSTITSGTTGRFLYDNAGVLGEGIIGSGLSFSGGTLSATGGGATTGFGVDGGTTAQSVTGTATINNAARLVKVATGWATGTLTFPAISAVSADTCIRVEDGGNFIDPTHTLTLKGGVSDGLNGGAANGTIGAFTTSGTFLIACVSAANNWNVGPGSVAASSAPSNQFANGVTINGLSYAQPAVSNLSGFGTGVATALGINIGSAGAPVVLNGALGTPSSGTLTNASGLPISGIASLGTGVGTALAANLSAAGGLASTISSGTSALGTSAISSAACASVVTTSATNTATTDVVLASFNGDPTAVTGYIPATTGMLTIISYPTTNNVNFKVCNNSSSSITPGAITLNWRVVR